jgi:putative ABC transport system permease protein
LRVAAFTVAVSLACGVLVGLTPGLQVQKGDLSDALKETARGSDGRRSRRMRSALVVAELSMAVVLLVGAGLMIRTVRNLAALDPGFNPESVLTLRLSIPRDATQPSAAGKSETPAPVVHSRVLLDRVRALPGVVDVALGSDLPLDGNASASTFAAEGMPPVDARTIPRAYRHRVTPEFFRVLGIPMLAGRTFAPEELSTTSTAAIVSERVVKRFWPGQDPIGRRITFGSPASPSDWRTIVGVVGEVKYRGLPDNPTADPDIYLPFGEQNAQVGLAIRARVPPSTLVAPVREAIRGVDPSIPVYSIASMDELIATQTSQSRFTMWLMSVFAAVAVALAVIGIYGVMSYLVTQRTREIGIRVALGAARRDILQLVVGSGARLVCAGVALGAVSSILLQQLIQSLLFGVTATDPAWVAAILLLTIVGLVACYLPAARAAGIAPLTALRHE